MSRYISTTNQQTTQAIYWTSSRVKARLLDYMFIYKTIKEERLRTKGEEHHPPHFLYFHIKCLQFLPLIWRNSILSPVI